MELYVSMVAALYSDARSLFAGTACACLAALATAWKSGEWALAACAAAMALVGAARFADMRAYARRKPGAHESVRHWEWRYIVGSSVYVSLLGTWCFLAFALTPDPAVHLISFAVTLGYLVGITGRNFSSDRLVTVQTLCAAAPMIAALVAHGGAYYLFLAALLVPFFLSIRVIAARLRDTLLEAVVASHEVKQLAGRFDTALNNMPHGLCMFDAEGRFVVANRRLVELLGLAGDIDRRSMKADDVLMEGIYAGIIPPADAREFLTQVKEKMARAERDTLSVETMDERTLEFTFQPMAKGGCVVLLEDITARRNAEAKIEHLACYDPLTGLPNRTLFRDRLVQSLVRARAGKPRAILFIDLDHFKQVNDTLGHPLGDALLCAVAERLRGVVRKPDIVARFGGDEFVVLQAIENTRNEAAQLAARIVRTLSQSYQINGHQIVIGASVGISMAPDDGMEVDELMKCADIALYRAKADGRGAWRFFEREMDVKAQARRALELDLREALERGAFELHYQPIFDLRTGRPSTCEALLRWPHPERGMIPPAEFVPIAEEMGLIVEIGEWVLRKACAECANWPNGVRVAVNLSPIQFRRSDVGAAVRAALDASGLDARRLEVEITESVLLQDSADTRAALDAMRAIGVRISLDDFGTGYSSLSYLRRFPLQKVKIDRSFLSDVGVDQRSLTLLRGVARLSAELGMTVTVEGVETQEQLNLLASDDSIDEVQGFLFSRPVPAGRIHGLLGWRAEQFEKVA